MTRGELSDDGATWNIPGSRTKNGRAHTVPLSPLVRELIASVKAKPHSPFIFTTTGTTPVSGWSRMKDRLDAAMLAAARAEGHAVIPPWTLHDLRRTFVTGMVELHVPPHVVELVVNTFPALGLASPAPTTAPSCFPNARRRSNAGRRTCEASWCPGRTAWLACRRARGNGSEGAAQAQRRADVER
jgi:Phage integrase family